MIRFVTVVTVFATFLMGLVAAAGFAIMTYAPLWLQIASAPVTAWLVCIVTITAAERGALDRWTGPFPVKAGKRGPRVSDL